MCIAKEHKSKLLQFMQELSFIYEDKKEFEMTWSGLDDYEMTDLVHHHSEIITSHEMRLILTP